MDFTPAMDVLSADLAPPPGHVREAAGEGEPVGPVVFEMQTETGGVVSLHARIRGMERAPLVSSVRAPRAGAEADLPGQRLVAAEAPWPEAGTEAVSRREDAPVEAPVSAVGRLTAMFGGRIRYCTATVVAERVVLTAAHCVFQRTAEPGERHFADWVLFQPQYEAGSGLGEWAGEAAYVLKGWRAPPPGLPASAYDFAFVRLDAPIAAQTGMAGLFVNAAPEGPFTSLGYPRQPSGVHVFDGSRLYATHGARLASVHRGMIKAENQLTEGSSGGPWLTRETGEPLLAGINSAKPVDSDHATWSPRLGQAFQHLFSHVLADMTGV